METAEKITLLRKVVALKDQSDELLAWMAERCSYKEYEDGETVVKTGDPIDWMWLIFEGKIDFYMDMNGKLVYYHSFVNGDQSEGVGGLIPYSRMKSSAGYGYSVGKVKGFQLNKQHFQDLEINFPEFTQKLIGFMTERARIFATTKLQHEKVNALGNLAAGIAHELNNPASAISRIATELSSKAFININRTLDLLKQAGTGENINAYLELAAGSIKRQEATEKKGTIKKLLAEDELEEWLNTKGIRNARAIAETFVAAGLESSHFQNIAGEPEPQTFQNLMLWLENMLSADLLIRDLSEASARISNLVTAIKSHVHMDRSQDAQCCTDIHKDIDNTLTLLGYKLRDKNIKVNKVYDENLPQVEAFIGELNQVWTNLLDNAIFALDAGGEIEITTASNEREVKIHFKDNGCGIPENIVNRIFDPFFTTKKVGQGTGIGLDTVKRIITRHNGDIKVKSEPGKTEFIICLPIKHKIAS